MSRIAGFLVAFALAACQRDVPAGGVAGKERSDCRPDKTCDTGLLCLSNLCVRPPPADCVAVGETLASMDLGNYAEPEERAPVVAKYRAQCEEVYVSKDEGACLDKAKDKWSAGQCAPRMFPEQASSGTGDCGKVATKIKSAMAQQAATFQNDKQMTKWFETTIRVMQESCEQDRWPDALKKCALAANDSSGGVDALQGCNQQMPPALQQKLQERMVAAMKGLQQP